MSGFYTSGKFNQYTKKLFNDDGCVLPNDIASVSLDCGGTLFIAAENKIYTHTVSGDTFDVYYENSAEEFFSFVNAFDNGIVAAACGKEVIIIKDGKKLSDRRFDEKVVSVKMREDELWILTEKRIVCTEQSLRTDKLNRMLEGGKVTAFIAGENGVFAATDTNLGSLHGKRMEWQNIFPERSGLPDAKINDLAFDELGFLWLATDDGVYIYDTRSFWLAPEKISQLPKNTVYKIAFDAHGGVYFASEVGVIILKDGILNYFSAEQWVPSNEIKDVAVSPDGKYIYAATEYGLSVISYYETTLSEKALYYDNETEKHNIRHGFIAPCFPDGSIAVTDNDGLWTAWYVAAESFRYASTGSEDALKKARRGMNALLFLEKITGIDGFPARAVRYPNEAGFGDGHREWSLSPDKTCEWRGDTSSDEITGHFFGLTVYYELCANDEEKETIRNSLCGIVDHITENSFRLIDRDGKPTTWANWNPDDLNHVDRWFAERGTNSLEFLMYIKSCCHMTGDKKYSELYRTLATRYRYALNVVRHKIRDAHICHIDDPLTFLSSLVLLMLEKDEALRKYYLCGLEDIWQYEKIERQPLFAFIHAAFCNRQEGLTEAVRSLECMPVDMKNYRAENSKRKGLVYDTEQAELFEEPQLKEPLSYHEMNITRPNRNIFKADWCGADVRSDGTAFLLPYWFGRYTGILREEE